MDSKSLDPMPESMTADELWLWGKSWLRDERECMLVFRLVGQTTCRLDKSPLSPLAPTLLVGRPPGKFQNF